MEGILFIILCATRATNKLYTQQKSCHYHYHHYTRPNHPKYLTFFVTIYTCEYLNSHKTKNIWVTIYREKNRRVFYFVRKQNSRFSNTWHLNSIELILAQVWVLESILNQNQNKFAKVSWQQVSTKNIPLETGTEMVSSRSYWLNEASHHHRSQSEWGQQIYVNFAHLPFGPLKRTIWREQLTIWPRVVMIMINNLKNRNHLAFNNYSM